MSQTEHLLVALLLLDIVWFLFLRRFFIFERGVKWWEDYFKEKFFF